MKTPIEPKARDEEAGVKWEILDQPENAPPFGSDITPLQVQVDITVEKDVPKTMDITDYTFSWPPRHYETGRFPDFASKLHP